MYMIGYTAEDNFVFELTCDYCHGVFSYKLANKVIGAFRISTLSIQCPKCKKYEDVPISALCEASMTDLRNFKNEKEQ